MKIVNKINQKQFLALTALTVLGCAFAQPCRSMNAQVQRRIAVLKNQIQPQQKVLPNNTTANIIDYDGEPSDDSSDYAPDSLKGLMSMVTSRITAENIGVIEKTQNVLEKFRKKKKLTTEDLIVLQGQEK